MVDLEVSFVENVDVACQPLFQGVEAASVPALLTLTAIHVLFQLVFAGELPPFLSCKHRHLDRT